MKRSIRTVSVTLVTVFALAASSVAAAQDNPIRSAGRDSTAPATTKTTSITSRKVVRQAGVTKTIVTVTTGNRQTQTTTYVKNGKRYVITLVRIKGKQVKRTVKVTPLKKASAKKRNVRH